MAIDIWRLDSLGADPKERHRIPAQIQASCQKRVSNKNGCLLRAALWRNPQFRRMSEDTCNGDLDILKGAVSSNNCLSLVFVFKWPNEKKGDVHASCAYFTRNMQSRKIIQNSPHNSQQNSNKNAPQLLLQHTKCAPAERKPSSTFQLFQCVSCRKPDSWILLALDGEFGVISAARLSRYVLDQSRNTRLTLSTTPARRSSGVEATSVNSAPCTLPSKCKESITAWCPCTLRIHEKVLGAPRAR